MPGIQKILSSPEKYTVIESKSNFKQDDWTCSFCELFSALRLTRIIPTNRTFADEIGLHQTGLSHVLRGQRNFPNNYRLKAEKALIKYDFSKATVANRINHDLVFASTTVALTERHTTLYEEVVKLKKEWSKLRLEVDRLMSKLIKIQDKIIEGWEE